MFFEFNQNNSGGSFIVDDKVCHWLFVEADNPVEANSIAENLGCYWNGVDDGIDCDCCGDRWYAVSDSDKLEFPIEYSNNLVFTNAEQYAEYLATNDIFSIKNKPSARVFYKNGTVKEFFSTRK